MLQDEDEGTADTVKAKLDAYAEVRYADACALFCTTVPDARDEKITIVVLRCNSGRNIEI